MRHVILPRRSTAADAFREPGRQASTSKPKSLSPQPARLRLRMVRSHLAHCLGPAARPFEHGASGWSQHAVVGVVTGWSVVAAADSGAGIKAARRRDRRASGPIPCRSSVYQAAGSNGQRPRRSLHNLSRNPKRLDAPVAASAKQRRPLLHRTAAVNGSPKASGAACDLGRACRWLRPVPRRASMRDRAPRQTHGQWHHQTRATWARL